MRLVKDAFRSTSHARAGDVLVVRYLATADGAPGFYGPDELAVGPVAGLVNVVAVLEFQCLQWY